tara:strand:- start:4494 stop:5708 length:1215 start_codon:yes stop_codon:yes gene_type:complete
MKKISTLPDLSLLKLNIEPTTATLWDVLARPDTKNSKDPDCHRHGPQTDIDDPTNCAQEGYLMCRSDLPTVPGRSRAARDLQGQAVTVMTEEGQREFLSLPPRAEKTQEFRMKRFEEINEVWINSYFNNLCLQGYDIVLDANGREKKVDRGILYWKFKKSMIEWTDWYYLDKEQRPDRRSSVEEKEAYARAKEEGKVALNRGVLFMRYFGTEAEKAADHMPHAGVFSRPYLYVTLVCANGSKGYGEKLMKMAHALAGELGVDTIVLATLPDPNTAGFYLMKMGYKFASRLGGYIDVSEWIIPHPDKEDKMLFVPGMDVQDKLESMLREAVRERVEDDDDRRVRNKRRAEERAEDDNSEFLQPEQKFTRTEGTEEEGEKMDTPATLPRVRWSLSGLISRLVNGYF